MTEAQFIELLRKNEEDISRLQAKKNKLIIVGAGNTTALYEKSIQAEKISLSGIVDNDLKKIGKQVLGMQVTLASNIADDYGNDCLALIVTSVDKTYQVLAGQMSGKVAYTGIDNYIFARHTSELIECYKAFDDKVSADLYAEVIAWHITCNKKNIPFPYSEAYFAQPEFIAGNEHEIFVDCGAYVGDSVERYLFTHLGITGGIYAFEPDENNFKKCLCRKKRLVNEWAINDDQFVVLPYGVGEKSCSAYVENAVQGLGSHVIMDGEATGGKSVQIIALDDYFKEKKVSFIKMDIESYEYDALSGAEVILKRDKPKLAICIYHNATDMYRTMLYLKSLNLGYCFRLGHHSVTKAETVLYAYVPCK